MSILDNNTNINNEPNVVANRIINQTKQTFTNMANSFNEGAKIFWQNPRGVSPEDIAVALGTNAKEIFELHYKLGQLLSSIKPEAIATGLSIIGTFNINNDGTVTILSSPSGSV